MTEYYTDKAGIKDLNPIEVLPRQHSKSYTAVVEDLTGHRSRLTLQIRGLDPQGAFDWCCANRGLKRVGDLEDHIEVPMERTTKWSWRSLWQGMTGPTI